jgi:hypothetical protein
VFPSLKLSSLALSSSSFGKKLNTAYIFVGGTDAHLPSLTPLPISSKAVLALTTYPAIYKTFAGDDLKIQPPRVYPPIFINR